MVICNKQQTKTNSKMGSISDETYTLHNFEKAEDDKSNKSYILDKFLTDHDQVVPPIPKRRTKIRVVHKSSSVVEVTRRDSLISQGTFTVRNSPINIEEKAEIENLIDDAEGDDEAAVEDESVKEDPREDPQINSKYDYKEILEIVVHKTDRLKLDSLISHPMIKVGIVDVESDGQYFKKSSKGRSVVFFYEDEADELISPIMTRPNNLQENRTLVPNWEESIILNEDFQYFLDHCDHLMIFFELLDFHTFSDTNKKSSESLKGLRRIAFAFLKLGKIRHYIGRKLRLELYYYPTVRRLMDKENDDGNIYEIWRRIKRCKKYSSSLYISIKKYSQSGIIHRHDDAETVLRSMLPTQREKIITNSRIKHILQHDNNLNDEAGRKSSARQTENLNYWIRKSSDKCKIPKHLLVSMDTNNDEGCLVMRFSHSGLLLACAVKIDDCYGISIIRIDNDSEKISEFPCHLKLIYCIVWSRDDSILITCSSDTTVVIYDVINSNTVGILPHECYLYCCDLMSEDVIAVGGFDRILRIWTKLEDDWVQTQEIVKHNGYLTCVVFVSGFLYSSSSRGEIFEWSKVQQDDEDNKWAFKRAIFQDSSAFINNFILFQSVKMKILMCCRDFSSVLDFKSGCILYNLHYGGDEKSVTSCTISPCGNLVVCGGSNDGLIHFWDLSRKIGKNCEIIDTLNVYNLNSKVSSVQYHPKDDLIAVAHYGSGLPIKIFTTFKEESLENSSTVKKEPMSNSATKLHFRDILVKMEKDIN